MKIVFGGANGYMRVGFDNRLLNSWGFKYLRMKMGLKQKQHKRNNRKSYK